MFGHLLPVRCFAVKWCVNASSEAAVANNLINLRGHCGGVTACFAFHLSCNSFRISQADVCGACSDLGFNHLLSFSDFCLSYRAMTRIEPLSACTYVFCILTLSYTQGQETRPDNGLTIVTIVICLISVFLGRKGNALSECWRVCACAAGVHGHNKLQLLFPFGMKQSMAVKLQPH